MGKNSLKQDDAAYASDELAAKVAANLSGIKGGGEPEPDDEPTPDDSENQTDDLDSTSDDDDSQTDDDDSTSDGDDDNSAGNEGDNEPPTIPEHLFRAALHQGWEPEEITNLYKQDSKLAQKTFEKLHNDVNNLSQQFSQLGKMARTKEQNVQQPAQQQQQIQQTQDFVDIAKLRKEYEDNPLIDVIETLNNGLKKVVGSNATPQQVQQQPTQPQDTLQEDMAAIQQINAFLGAKDMGDYDDFYGPTVDANKFPLLDWRGLSPGQQANRQALVSEADLILAGADLIGRRMTIAEALTMAHLRLTAPMQQQVVRSKIVNELKKRNKGITLRSKGSKKAADKGGQKSDEQLEAVTQERLNRLFK